MPSVRKKWSLVHPLPRLSTTVIARGHAIGSVSHFFTASSRAKSGCLESSSFLSSSASEAAQRTSLSSRLTSKLSDRPPELITQRRVRVAIPKP